MKLMDLINRLVDIGNLPESLIIFTGEEPGLITIEDLKSDNWKVGIKPSHAVDSRWYSSHSASTLDELVSLLESEELYGDNTVLLTSTVIKSYTGSPSTTGITALGAASLKRVLPELVTILATSKSSDSEPKRVKFVFGHKDFKPTETKED